jgi:predicted transport protein
MSLEKIVNELKKPKEEKVVMSFNIPVSLKQQLVDLSKENGFTVNAFLVAMIDEVLNKKSQNKTNLEILGRLEELRSNRAKLKDEHDFQEAMSGNVDIDIKNELKEIDYMINLLKEQE